MIARKKQKQRIARGRKKALRPPRRFGGRATATGVNYEVRVAAFIATKMLAGNLCSVWDGISGADVSAITMQAPEPVDDIVVSLGNDREACIYISAKERRGTIPHTRNSPAFADTVHAFVRQFLKLPGAERAKSRLVWAVPSSAGTATTHELLDALNTHRMDAGDTSLSRFLCGRQVKAQKALNALLSVAKRVWRKESGSSPTEENLRSFLRQVYVEVYDFECGQRLERHAENDIRSHIAANATHAQRIWDKLEHFFAKVDQRGVRITRASLRRVLVADTLQLKAPPDYAREIVRLQELSTHNLSRLKEHAALPFGPTPADAVHIPRTAELSALILAIKSGHLLITGEPGCGKSGIIHALVDGLQRDGVPVVLLLAEEVFGANLTSSASSLGLTHTLDEILRNWPDGACGFLITDALDAVRDVDALKMLRDLLRTVQVGQSGWTVVASVREFDLKYGRELREMFRGQGALDHNHPDFAGVAHFHLSGLQQAELDWLGKMRPEIRPFIESANRNLKSRGLQRSPFYLRLAAELLDSGVNPGRLADWSSPALLLRSFWLRRIDEGDGADDRVAAVRKICERMVSLRNPTLSAKEIVLTTADRQAIRELRSRGLLQGPAVRYGVAVGEEAVRFSHHLLHDYAIARTLIPILPDRFCEFARTQPLLPVFYRPSFLFSLEEIWDLDPSRYVYWETSIRLEGAPALHGVTRIAGPILAARRVELLADLNPLLKCVQEEAAVSNSGPAIALQHLASGLQDADAGAIQAGADAWCAFAVQLSKLLCTHPAVESPLVLLLARLASAKAATSVQQESSLSAAGRALLAFHLRKPVNKGWPYAAMVAIETVCQTFKASPHESEKLLLEMMSEERIAQFPQEDLFRLAQHLRPLGEEGATVILRLFECAFGVEPEPGQWQQFGTQIMPMRIQSRDQWQSICHSLADYYYTLKAENPTFATKLVCVAASSCVRRREGRRPESLQATASVQFRGRACELVEDHSHIWAYGTHPIHYEEHRIISHFEELLASWANEGDAAKINSLLDAFALHNQLALLWSVLLDAGANQPQKLGHHLITILDEPSFLTCRDCAYAATRLLGALHATGGSAIREQLEHLILNLPANAHLHPDVPRTPVPPSVEHAQNRLLGSLKESNITLPATIELFKTRNASSSIVSNSAPEGIQVHSHTYSDEELLERRGVSLKDAANERMIRLRDQLKLAFPDDQKKFDAKNATARWRLILEAERAVKRYRKTRKEMACELWAFLVAASHNLVRFVEWPQKSKRWTTIRRILLGASVDPLPSSKKSDDDPNAEMSSWSWPCPRVDAASALPTLVYRIGKCDRAIERALWNLSRDSSHPVRFHLAENLTPLWKPTPELLWRLTDATIAKERVFFVLAQLMSSLDWLLGRDPENTLPRIAAVISRANSGANSKNHIHERLAATQLYHFLRTGNEQCGAHLDSLIACCDTELGFNALVPLLHNCRAGGWLTAGTPDKPDAHADTLRARTWAFFLKVLKAAQEKATQRMEHWKLHGPLEGEALKEHEAASGAVMRLIDNIASQLYFISGTFDERTSNASNGEEKLSPTQMKRLWTDAKPIFRLLVASSHPHTAYELVQTLNHFMAHDPRDAFLLATQAICSSSLAGFQREPLAVPEVVKLIQHALADHRDLFQIQDGRNSECLEGLLAVLDLFVEAGWPEARQLTHRLEEIYR
jgi:hypothetical protein